ncbi:MAG: NAD(P)-dependent oxidoreductase [Pseudomonadota bacterium]
MTKVTVLGLGATGSRMAVRLIDAGHDGTVWNRTPDRAAPLVTEGATLAETPQHAAQNAEIVLSMVNDDAAARAVWLGSDGALSGLAPTALAVESSTTSPDWIGELAKATGPRLLDAPVAGSRPQAEAGDLIFLTGGTPENAARFEPVAQAMGRAVLHAGPQGKGIALKLIVNGLLGLQTAALAELLAYGETMGLPAAQTMDLISDTPVTSPAAKIAGALIAAGNHAPLFTVDQIIKDLRYLTQGTDMPVLETTRAAFEQAQQKGNSQKHITAVAL